jgi:thiol-disulfide isomerase/thioredoxin
MRKLLVLLTALTMIAGLCPWSAETADKFRVNREILGRLEFPMPESEAGKRYLGLSGDDKFTLSQIRARTVILEIFSMYCPICQGEAPTVNELHRLIEKDVRLKGKVKVVGIGTGNTPFEVDVFRKKYDIRFPLFADEGFLMQKTSEDRIRTPTFLTLKIELGKDPIVQDVHVGKLGSPRKFLESLPGFSRGK